MGSEIADTRYFGSFISVRFHLEGRNEFNATTLIKAISINNNFFIHFFSSTIFLYNTGKILIKMYVYSEDFLKLMIRPKHPSGRPSGMIGIA